MLRIIASCGRVPALYLRSNRSAPGADPVPHHLVVRPELLAGLLVGVGDVARRVDAERQHRLAELGKGLVVELDVWGEAARVAADDGERERKAVPGGAHDRFRTAADADPGAERRAPDRRGGA